MNDSIGDLTGFGSPMTLGDYPHVFEEPTGFNPNALNLPDLAPQAGGNSNDAAWPEHGNSHLNIEKTIEELDDSAEPGSKGKCASYVRQAIEAGGIVLKRPLSTYAEDYGPSLEEAGFVRLVPRPAPDYIPQAGDVVVIHHYEGGNLAGHMAMYDGYHWVSDFVQNPKDIPNHRNIWPNQGYRNNTPSYEVYRP